MSCLYWNISCENLHKILKEYDAVGVKPYTNFLIRKALKKYRDIVHLRSKPYIPLSLEGDLAGDAKVWVDIMKNASRED
jgi:hypothetical protein